MGSERINYLLNNSSEATEDDIVLLENEIREFPYSQFLHILLAKIQYQLDSEEKNKKLSIAAIYSCDRSILKKIIQDEDHFKNHGEIIPYQDLLTIEQEEDLLNFDAAAANHAEENESSSIFDEVLKNLEQLKSLRKQFQFLEMKEQEAKKKEKIGIENKSDKKTKTIEKVKPKHKKHEKPKKSVSQLNHIEEIVEKDAIIDTQVNEFFLKEIEKNTETLEQKTTDKNPGQSQIIEKFIEEQPSIGSLKKEVETSSDKINKDLSVKSTEFGDDLISENLAIILLKQGKKERSIDIYKKLIWKLPQKKAYFAARIEEIKR